MVLLLGLSAISRCSGGVSQQLPGLPDKTVASKYPMKFEFFFLNSQFRYICILCKLALI